MSRPVPEATRRFRPDVPLLHPCAEQTGGFEMMVPLLVRGEHNVGVYSYSSDSEAGPLPGYAPAPIRQ